MLTLTAWNWADVCPTGIRPWLPPDHNGTANAASTSVTDHQQLAPCFQQLFMQLPVLVLFALLSAYQFGAIAGTRVQRDRIQRRALLIRFVCVLLLAALIAWRVFYWTLTSTSRPPWPSDVLLTGVETIAYAVHAAYLQALRRRGSCNHRAPLAVRVCWITVFMLVAIRTLTAGERTVPNVVAVLLHAVYLVTLVPMGEAQRVARPEAQRNDVSVRSGFILCMVLM